MSLPRYPDYKDSGVEWLGDVPGHWVVIPLSRTASDSDSMFIDGDWIESKDLSEDGIRYLTSGNVGDGFYKEQGQGFISVATFAELNCIEVVPGDILISRLNLPIGRSCLVPDLASRIVTCVDNVIVRPDREFDRRFFVYVLSSKSHFANMENLARGTTMQRISRSTLGRVRFAFPPLPEQTQIAAFLDRETAKIDSLVAEQRRLMELLKEKRQAVVSHAVTRGLNPDAPMKPSGIEWLGDVPEHWAVTPVKFVAEIGNGSTPSREVPEYWAETGFPWLNSSVVNSDIVTEPEGFVTERALRECHLPVVIPPAILVGITGQGRTRGMAAMLGIEATINQHVAYVKPNSVNLEVNYLLEVFESAYLKLRRDSEEAGATKGAITCRQIGDLRIPVPPVAEQIAIATFLKAESTKFATLTTEAQRAIDLLQERRTALISAAVTGQIDVRNAGAA